MLLGPYRDIKNALSLNLEWRRFIRGPERCITQQPGVVYAEHVPESAINIPRKIDYAAAASLADKDTGIVRIRRPREDLFHRQIGIRRDYFQGRVHHLAARLYVNPMCAVDDPARVFQS